MKLRLLALTFLSSLGLVNSSSATAEDAATPITSTYIAKVDPDAFREKPHEHKKLGVTVDPATVRMIVPGIDKFSIYKMIGPPHFGEGITRRWNYVLFFPIVPGSTERVRCRMEIRFGSHRTDGYNIAVSEVIWKDQACADRVASAG